MKIHRLLIANRGEIARRILRTAHRMGLETVAVYSDADAQALHVREATYAHALGGDASADSYLRIDKIIDAALATQSDAVHPGYGFLSENADFAQAVIDAGLTWVGPPPEAIRTLGSKSRAKQLAIERGVPCLPGYQGEDQSGERLAAEARRIGFPVMVKAAAGGGGRGMRLVTRLEDLPAAIQSARSEAQSAFGSGELLLERALLAPRHVEIQVFADAHGHCIHLGERDCSVQRRHQKIIEETPSPAISPELRERMGRCAIELAQAAGYVGAGTVEFLVDGGEFFLMEMNTRLQVEHPVTEMVTGLDLVEWQLRVAQGEPLPSREIAFTGHAIEVRLCAEDETFIPHTGTVSAFLPPPLGEGRGGGTLRLDHAVCQNQHIPPYYDSMLAKLIAHAPTRDEAITLLAAALDRLTLLGLPTNRRFLAACLRHPVFRAGDALIPFLAEHGDELRVTLREQEEAELHEAARAVLLPQAAPAALANPFPRPARIEHRARRIDVPLGERDAAPAPHASTVRLPDGRHHVQIGSIDLFLRDASFDPPANSAAAGGADELRAPFNGKVIAIKAEPGGRVAKGEPLVILESMKLEHALAAPRDAQVRAIHLAPGQQAATSQVLVSFEPA
jgi:geranyl-CoA carboxylase alpha subunit